MCEIKEAQGVWRHIHCTLRQAHVYVCALNQNGAANNLKQKYAVSFFIKLEKWFLHDILIFEIYFTSHFHQTAAGEAGQCV